MKRKSNQGKSADFKRLKAKVGKRAPKALNATDTSFQTSSLHVRKQAIDPNESDKKKESKIRSIEDLRLISSRGKPLSSLLIQLNHPSPSMRSSSLQGIQDAVVTSSSIAVRTNLSLLIPALSKCFVDEDDSVRSVAISCLRHVYQSACDTSSNLDTMKQPTLIMRPFLPLHSAYLSSALNSLDESIRMDGVKVAEMTFTFFPLLMRERVAILLPSYIRLLAQLSTSSSSSAISGFSNKNSNKGQKKKKKQKNGSSSTVDHHRKAVLQLSNKDLNRCLILKSLFSLLRSNSNNSTYNNEEDENTTKISEWSDFSFNDDLHSYKVPDLTFQIGGTASNAILFPKPFTSQQILRPVSTYIDFPSIFSNTNQSDASEKSTIFKNFTVIKLKPSLVERSDLLFQLRDSWIEVTQHGDENNSMTSKGIALDKVYLEQALLIVNSTRYFWNQYCRSFHGMRIEANGRNSNNPVSLGGKRKQSKVYSPQEEFFQQILNLKSATKTLLNIFMETFPIRNDSLSNTATSFSDDSSKYDLLNASISSLLAEIGGVLALEQNQGKLSDSACALHNESVQQIFGYVLPRLSENHFGMDNNMEIDSDNRNREYAQITTNITLLKVVSKLLLPMKGAIKSSSINAKLDVDWTNDDGEGIGFYLLNEENRFKLLTHFGNSFFPKKLGEIDSKYDSDNDHASTDIEAGFNSFISLGESVVGRKALILSVNLIYTSLQEKTDIRRIATEQNGKSSTHEKYWIELMRIIRFFPTYLEALGGEYPQISATMLNSLISVLRNYRPKCEATNIDKNKDKGNFFQREIHIMHDLVMHIRKKIVKIFLTIKIKTKSKGNSKSFKSSIFEQYPEFVQRIAIEVVGVLSEPCKYLLHSLSQICSRSSTTHGISDSIANYIYEVLYSIRKNVNIKDYLGFLINSIGFESPPKTKIPPTIDNENVQFMKKTATKDSILTEKIFNNDHAIARVARETINCGGYYKILPMLSQILKSWLLIYNSKPNINIFNASKARAALAIIAACSLDQFNSLPSTFNSTNSINEPFQGAWTLCASTICDVFMSSSWANDDIYRYTQMSLSPVLVLLQCHPHLWEMLLTEISKCLCETKSNDIDISTSGNILNSLLLLLKPSSPLRNMRKEDSVLYKKLMKLALDVESKFKDGPLDRLAGKFKIEVVMIGKEVQKQILI